MGEWKTTGCNFCAMGCNLQAYVEDDHILDIRPDPNGVRNSIPYCCRKGRSSKYFQENPERLNYPLKKVGDHFERISWEQAYREIGEKAKNILERYGPRAFAFIGGALASDQSDLGFAQFVMEAIGSQYLYNPVGIEFMGHWWSNGRITGHQSLYLEEDIDPDNIDAFILWGSNAYVSHQLVFGEGRKFLKDMGEHPDKRLIVVDPRMSESARLADMHIMPRPGTDALLVRGLISLIIEKGWEDKAYLNKWCSDWDKAKRWYTGFDYRKAFEVCEVPYEQMEELAKYLSTHTFGLHQDLGIFFNRNNTISSYLLDSLCAVTGNLLIKGQRHMEQPVPPGPASHDERCEGTWRTVETGKFRVSASFPVAVLGEEMLSEKRDRLRCAFLSMSNPVISFPDSDKLEKGFDNLDLFVAIDVVMTETTKHADYVLPGKTGFEAYQWSIFSSEQCFLKHPIIGQIGEREADAEIIMNIAKAMGLVPEMPDFIYKAAAKSVKDRDIIPYLLQVMAYLKTHPKYKKYETLMMIDALARPEALGSVARTMMRMGLVISPLAPTKSCDRAGYKALKQYRLLNKLGPAKALADMSKMDQVFWALDDNESGTTIAKRDPDPERYMYDHIFWPDHKIRLFDEIIDEHIKYITPEKEEAALKEEMGEYPLLISSGNHEDGGDNATMRNPDTYKYRDPYTVLLNPEDAEKMGISDGQKVKISTKRKSIEAPAEVTYRMSRGYCMIPHHYGMEKDGKVYYGAKSSSIVRDVDMDPITGNPYLRWVPCKVEPVTEQQ